MEEQNEYTKSEFSSNVESDSRQEKGIQWTLSPTLKEVLKKVGAKEKITASALSHEILEQFGHKKEYAKGAFLSLSLHETEIEKPADEWVSDVQSLFDPANIKEASDLNQPVTLHGRLAILGLGLLDDNLKRQLEENDVFQVLADEINQPFEQILSEKGKALQQRQKLAQHPDRVQNLADEPLENAEDDMLGRHAFTRFLARTINEIVVEKGAYSIHLSGSWGSGKSTILNFLEAELAFKEDDNNDKQSGKNRENQFDRNKNKWIVVQFNAWKNQHITPPWWPMYTKIYSVAKSKLPLFYRVKEFFWRLVAGQSATLIVIILLFWGLVIVFSLLTNDDPDSDWKSIAKSISGIVALLTTVAGTVIGFSKSLLFGSANAAKSFQQYADDPMEKIYDRFGRLAKQLEKKKFRLLIIIDDVDRCSSEYVVRLLEGIQTLFRQGAAVFVVAADRKWLHTCFEQEYENFKDTVREPGKPLGALFLEKTFQLSTPVPSIPKEFKQDYWNKLINIGIEELKQKVKESRADVKNDFSENPTDGEINGMVNTSKSKSIQEQIAIREEALWHLASPETRKRTEHTLKPFLPLLENNPRALIRLVNMYSVNRARAIMSFQDIQVDDLAQWTILTMRWPQLAEYLVANPEKVSDFGKEELDGIDNEVLHLFNDDAVMKVVNGGEGVTGPLDATTMKKCLELG